jgi:hypothetical protein
VATFDGIASVQCSTGDLQLDNDQMRALQFCTVLTMGMMVNAISTRIDKADYSDIFFPVFIFIISSLILLLDQCQQRTR